MNVVDEVIKEGLEFYVLGEKFEMEIGNERVLFVEVIKKGLEFYVLGELFEMEISNERVVFSEVKGIE